MNFIHAGEVAKGKALLEESMAGAGPAMAENIRLFLQALSDPSKLAAYENHIGKADESESFMNLFNISYITVVDPDYLYEYLGEMECPEVGYGMWGPRFKEQRKTPEFFELMQRAGTVEYWREYGWPDDCASLDQSLAECP
jgi:hypothetical protein